MEEKMDTAKNRLEAQVANVHANASAKTRAVARRLGWFSVVLGAVELLMPQAVGRATGLKGRSGLLRLHGLRELGIGVGLLTERNTTAWLMARVAGDAVDMATLGSGLRGANPQVGRTAVAMGAVAGVALLDAKAVLDSSRQDTQAQAAAFDYSDRAGLKLAVDALHGSGPKLGLVEPTQASPASPAHI